MFMVKLILPNLIINNYNYKLSIRDDNYKLLLLTQNFMLP